MIQARLQISGQINEREKLSGGLNATIKEIKPELENVNIEPSIEQQILKSEKYGYGEVIVNPVTSDIDEDIKPENIKVGVNILGVEGGYEGMDTSDADATANDICMGKTAYVNGEKITGNVTTVSNSKGVDAILVADLGKTVAFQAKFTEPHLFKKGSKILVGENYAKIADEIKLTPEKIVEGNTIIGVKGSAKLGTDTTDANAIAADIIKDKTAYVNGEKVTGTYEPLDTSDADATANDICMGKTAYVNGEKITGKVFEAGQTSMMTSDIEVNDSRINITKVMPQDYLFRKNGSITYNVKHADMSKAIGLTPEKIVEGNTIIGVSGTQKILDTSDADATAADIMKDKTAYVNGVKVVGTHEDTASEGEYNAIVTPNGTIFSVKNAFSEMGDLDLTGIKSLTEAFKDFINLKKIKSISNTSNLTSLYYAFSGCTSLEEIPNFDTQNVTDMRNTFYGCSVLTKIPNFNTSKVTKMSYTFSNCKKLEEIPYLETSNVTDMSYMFRYAQSIKTIPQLDMSKVTTAYYMFNYASKLETIPLLDFSKITNMISMFDQCPRLQSVPLLDTSSATTMNRIFCNCASLTEVPQLNTSKVTDFGAVFLSCSSLHTIPELDGSRMNNINSTFDNCTKLANFGGLLNIGQNYTQKSANYYDYTFRLSSCNSLTHESLMNIINGLYDLNLRYDVANGGTLYTQQLVLGSTNISKLSAEELQICTEKGWSVS